MHIATEILRIAGVPPVYSPIPMTWAFMIGDKGQNVIAARSTRVVVPVFELVFEGDDPHDPARFFKSSIEERVRALIHEASQDRPEEFSQEIGTLTDETRPNQVVIAITQEPQGVKGGGKIIEIKKQQSGTVWRPDRWTMQCGIICYRRNPPGGEDKPVEDVLGRGIGELPSTWDGGQAFVQQMSRALFETGE